MADIWSEKNVGFIGQIKFLSDLTVGPTYFAKPDDIFASQGSDPLLSSPPLADLGRFLKLLLWHLAE